MAVTSVKQFATELGKSAETLLEQLSAAGVPKKSEDDSLTDTDKTSLLDHLKLLHGTGGDRKKITLHRKQTSEIKQADATGKARTIQVEVRKKRVFIQRDEAPAEAAVEDAPSAPVVSVEELTRREEEARRQAELLTRQEAEIEARQKAAADAEAERERTVAQALVAAEAAKLSAAQDPAASAKTAKTASTAKTANAVTNADASAAPATTEPDAASVAAAAAAAAEQVKKSQAKAQAADESARLVDIATRRKAAEDEADKIRTMMQTPKKVAKAPEPVKPPAAPVAPIKGTIHKPAAKPGAPAAPGAAPKPGVKGNTSVKSEKLSSSWSDDAAKKRQIKTRGDSSGGRDAWKTRGKGARGGRDDRDQSSFSAPAEVQIKDVHIAETISVADLAHKMSVKAAEVIKHLMKLGQMVTINQVLDQETAMIVVEEMGHKAFAAFTLILCAKSATEIVSAI